LIQEFLTLWIELTTLLLEAWPAGFVGGALVLLGAFGGWEIAKSPSFLLVRGISWWLTRVIVPLLLSRSWGYRAAVIFINNSLVLACVLATGFDPIVSLVAASGLGVSLGIGLRVLSNREDSFSAPRRAPNGQVQGIVKIGIALNLLELPAIFIAVGLAIGQSWLPLPAGALWVTYASVVVPMLLISACGESLWLGECRPKTSNAE